MNSNDIDFDFRPATYWPEGYGDIEALSRIKGTYRRRRAKEILEEGGQLPSPDGEDSFFGESLSDSDRQQMGRIHPALMGGEYLPDLEEYAAEIVRVELESTLADVISIRATPAGQRITYSVVDEYGMRFALSPKSSKDPFSMRQVIRLIDGVHDLDNDLIGLTDRYRDMNLQNGGDPAELVTFVTVSSTFYPQLEAYYREQAQDWLKRAKAARS